MSRETPSTAWTNFFAPGRSRERKPLWTAKLTLRPSRETMLSIRSSLFNDVVMQVTGHPSPIFRHQGRYGLRAWVERLRAAGMEGASRRRPDEARRIAGYRREFLGLQVNDGMKEPLGVRMERVPEDFPDRSFLHDAPRVHHRHSVTRLGHNPEVVRHEEKGEAVTPPQLLQDLEDLALDDHVQGGRGFVRDDQFRLEDERHRNHDALPHSAAEFMGIVAKAARGNADGGQGLQRHRLRVVLSDVAVLSDELREVILDGHERVEAGDWVLEDESNFLAADLPEFGSRKRRQISSFK